jgi:ABC-type multidrug transport system fused ATPase/permease subunit
MNVRKGCFRLILISSVVVLLAMSIRPVAIRFREWDPGDDPDNILRIPSWFLKPFAVVVTIIWLLAITRPLGWVFLGVIVLVICSAFVYIVLGFTDPIGTKFRKQRKELKELKEKIQSKGEGRAVTNLSAANEFDRT